MRLFLLSFLMIYTSSFAKEDEQPFKVPFSKSIKIDGETQEWRAIPFLSKPFGIELKPPYTDVMSLKVAMDKEYLYLLLNTKNHAGAIKDTAFLKIVVDTDNNKTTGSSKDLRLNKYVPVPGFEIVIPISINQKAIPHYKIYDISTPDVKPIASYSSDSIMNAKKGNYMEIKIPFKDFLKDEHTISRIIFSEVGHEQDWKNPKAYVVKTLDLSDRHKKEVVSIEEKAEIEEKLQSSFSVAWIIILGFGFWLVWPAMAICKKAGFASTLAFSCLIPVIGPFIFMWLICFSNWQLHSKFCAQAGEADE
ncbi:hypothetical protein PQO03_03560 [Lentisphaera profundi]|uniref:Uncharacterized protein n=1 Tax=Lentisphaera profundi TaxID=1658616 RepID=A0ABY7VY89_9BACT|nr:hypothetical protein [Lentisphaera profundi]WDE97033.1 hypothetical protein PQO03_03560 [Lentisphaera profundi]